ncbi:disintegrin and metalloproteinase domain-containing protein 17 [Folsomia candida]|uniref:disintegrin and metalloproteinase domain-containing protein 17 n=1 Tax=Folsomia candida TaxID=158441 RepID=UPI001604A635|nr:disintegrin and metalloproteinase domain-containing protein 17 [Folsomia candida]
MIPNIRSLRLLMFCLITLNSLEWTASFPLDLDNNLTLKSATLSQKATRVRRSLLEFDAKAGHANKQLADIFHAINDISSLRAGLVCNLCIVVDQEFVDAYKLKESTQVIIFFRKIIDRISWVFRNIDWNGDGRPDNIGFEIISLVKGWTPYTAEYSGSYSKPKPAMELLGLFAQHNFHHCCLGVGFTNRPFAHNQVGVSFIASEDLLGGICDFRNPTLPLHSANVALISAMGLKGVQLSERDLGNVLIHELGHCFGVLKHDMDLEPKCSGFDTNKPIPADYISDHNEPPQGRFIMWGQDIQGTKTSKPNNLNFSPCSKAVVQKVLYSGTVRGKCLTPGENEIPYCGNGIVELPEECDCGNELKCLQDSCCGPRGSSDPCQLYKGIDPLKCSVLNQRLLSTPGPRSNKTKSGGNMTPFISGLNTFLIIIVQLAVFLQ